MMCWVILTKSNVVKTTDGRFSRVGKRIAKEYEQYGIVADEWYIDIMTAKLLDPEKKVFSGTGTGQDHSRNAGSFAIHLKKSLCTLVDPVL